MVLVWAASPSRLAAYSFVIGIMVAAFAKFFKLILCLGALAFISESNVSQVELLFAFQFCYHICADNCFSSLVEALGVCYFS